MTLAGTPPTTVPGSTSLVTTAPVPAMALSAIVTPGSMVALEPIYTLRPSVMGAG